MYSFNLGTERAIIEECVAVILPPQCIVVRIGSFVLQVLIFHLVGSGWDGHSGNKHGWHLCTFVHREEPDVGEKHQQMRIFLSSCGKCEFLLFVLPKVGFHWQCCILNMKIGKVCILSGCVN